MNNFMSGFGLLLLLLNILSIFYHAVPVSGDQDRILKTLEEDPLSSAPVYRFEDPIVAYHILEALDNYEQSSPRLSAQFPIYHGLSNSTYYGLIPDQQYCQKHRANFVNDPQSIFTTVNIFSEYDIKSNLRTNILPEVGIDIQPNVGVHMGFKATYAKNITLRPDATVFFCFALYMNRQVGKQYSCLTQESNHIPGNSLLVRKDYAAESLTEYKKFYESRPQCLKSDKFFPKTYILAKEDQCRDFFSQLNSVNYQELKNERNIVYIRKVGLDAHAGSGVRLVDQTEEESLRTIYQNGTLCGNVTKNLLIQNLVHNPLLFNGRKFDFRVFMLVASTNPMIAYYHDGVIWLSTEDYDPTSTDRTGFMPNACFNDTFVEKIEQEGTYHGKNLSELQEETTKFYDDLQEHLLETGVITDPNWLDNYLRPEFKKAMVHILRMGNAAFLKTSSVYELLGLDFMLDENLNVWYLEANAFPSFEQYTKKEGEFLKNLARDHFEIVNGLLRSRTKRIINYVNNLINEDKGWVREDKAFFDNEAQRRVEFNEAIKNRFEPEFEPSSSNGFSKIWDDNLQGLEKYSGLLTEECL